MPKNTKVHKLAHELMRNGMPKGQAIATAQKKTGQSYATGKKTGAKKRAKKG